MSPSGVTEVTRDVVSPDELDRDVQALGMHSRLFTMTCRCHSHVARALEKPARQPRRWREATITVVRGGRSAIVRPATLPAKSMDGVLCVRLMDIWSASRLPGDLLSLTFDFLGKDGFRPTRHGYPPMNGKLLERGHLELETGRLEWDTYEDLACAYRVKGLTMMVAYGADDAPDPGSQRSEPQR